MPLSRRQLLQSAGALSLLLPLVPGAHAAIVSQSSTPPDGRYELNDWIWVGPSGDVVIGVSQCEVGQGIYTGLAEVIAAEMGADWNRVTVQFVTGRDAYRQAAGGEPMSQFVAASTSMTNFYARTRLAGAQARSFFISAAARKLNVPASELHCAQNRVEHLPSGQRIGWAELIPYAREIPLDPAPRLLSAEEEADTFIGKDVARIDTPEKVDGSAIFGIDIEVPNMLTGVPWMVPSLNGKLIKIRNEAAIRALPGVVDLVITRHWSMLNMVKLDSDMSPNTVIVVAESYWQAKKAADLLDVEYQLSDKDNFSSATIAADNRKMLDSDQLVIATNRGQAPETINNARGERGFHEARYRAPYIVHATMEPCNATCFVEPDKITLWGPFQGQDLPRTVLAKMFKLQPEDVTLHNTLLGGSFGRKYLPDTAMHAALASKRTGRPVKVVYPREIDIQHGYYRPGNTSHYQALLDDEGYPTALWARYAGQGLFWQVHRHRVETHGGWDETIVECAYNTVYDIPELRVECGIVEQAIPLSFLRGVGSVASIFFLESFISELSHKAGIDEYQYRRRLLKNSPEMIKVLDATAARANWDQPLPANRFRGMAVNLWVGRDNAFRSYVVMAVEIEVIGNSWRLARTVCGIDCGKAINPNLIRLNMEGGIGFALTGILYSCLHFEQGGVVESNFKDYGLIGLEEMPEVEVEIVASDRPPQGCGELSTAVVAPAVASALLKATGRPWGDLPFDKRLEPQTL